MISLLGVGNTGSKIVEQLSKYEQYNIITIDEGNGIKKCSSPEEYENKCPSFKKLFKKIDKKVFVFISASGNISGALLRILEQLKENNVNVVCISSDSITLSSMANLQQNLVVGVLQEYARSGMIDNLYLLDNSKIEDIMTDVSIDQYWEKINETIAYLFHTFMFFDNTEPTIKFGDLENNIANIHTFSFLDKEKQKKLLYELKYVTNEIYYFSLGNDKKKNSLKEIKNFALEQSQNTKIGVHIYESDSKDDLTYFLASTSIPQTKKSEFGSLDKQNDL
jgi:hypothetical protein